MPKAPLPQRQPAGSMKSLKVSENAYGLNRNKVTENKKID